MSNKTQRAYEDVFNYINDHVFSMSSSQSFTTDYELAMRNALRKLYPNAEQIACYFHFTQAVKRNASKMPGLVDLIHSNETAKSIYYRLHCLPLLPPEHIVDVFKQLRNEANETNANIFRSMFTYYHNQWIKKVFLPCLFVDLHLLYILVDC